MSVSFIDRRKNDKGKSIGNRQRFLRRIKAAIKAKAHELIGSTVGATSKSDNAVIVSKKSISEPRFAYGNSSYRRMVVPGNYKYVKGDPLDLNELLNKGQGGGKGGSKDGSGEDDFVVNVSRDEFLDYFFEDLELPNMEKTSESKMLDKTNKPAGFQKDGSPNKLALLPSIRNAKMRKRALETPWRKKLAIINRRLEEIDGLFVLSDRCGAERERELIDEQDELIAQRKKCMARIAAIPFIDNVDLRYRTSVKVPIRRSSAAIFFIMDNSGSMGEEEKTLARKFFTLLYLFVIRKYETVDLVFVSHTDKAHEVDEETFFTTRESGGTVVSTALTVMRDIYNERYSGGDTNVYVCQASDGDNWEDDNKVCKSLLLDEILPVVQHYAYVQVEPDRSYTARSELYEMYKSVVGAQSSNKLACKRLKTAEDIYPTFREFFSKSEGPSDD